MDWKPQIRAAFAVEHHVPDEDVIEELSQHAAATYEAARAEGCSPAEAEGQVAVLLASWCREASSLRRRPRRPPVVEAPAASSARLAGLGRDVLYAARLLRRQPGYALVAILTMALGIGATTTLVSVAYGVLLKPLPWPDADRLVRVTETRQGRSGRIRGTIGNGTYIAWHNHPSTIEQIGGWLGGNTSITLTSPGEPTRLQRTAVTPTLFSVLGARPLLGRLFLADDGLPGGSSKAKDVVILSYGLWQDRFGGRDDIVGQVIAFDGKPLTIVGVMRREFEFPDRETRAWTPFAVSSVIGEQGSRRVSIFPALARLRPGVTTAQAAAEGTARGRAAPDPGLAGVAMFGGSGPPEVLVAPALEVMTAEVRPAIAVLLVAVGLLLATATANVASLQLARATTRRREIAIRSALGAGAGRLTRQLLVESSMLGIAGGIAGVLMAAAIGRALPALLPADFPRVADIGVSVPVMAVAAALAIATGVAFGVLPALHARRLNLVDSLAEDGQAPVGTSGRSRVARARTFIMSGQIAITCVLLVGAALLARSFVALLHADRGYDPANVLTARLALPSAYSAERRAALVDRLLERLAAVPGVAHAAAGNALPLLTSGGYGAFKMRSPLDPAVEIEVQTITRIVSPGYFAALGLRLAAGRLLTGADTATSAPAIVVNGSFARKYLHHNPIGDRVPGFRGNGADWEVVGVVDDVRQGEVGDPPQPEMFISYRQASNWGTVSDVVVVLRTRDDPARHASTLRSLVRAEDPSLALDSIMTMEDRVMTSLAKPRLFAVLLGGFALFALAIAGVGLFGVLSYSVAQRSREIGVRTALGARPWDIVRLVLTQAVAMTLGGLAVGLWSAFALVRLLAKLLYGVSANDAVSFVAVPIVLAIVAALACVVPARRAARVDPLRVLRAG